MLSIIIAFPKLDDAVFMKNMLVSSGFEVNAVCVTAAQAISIANELDGGVLICGYRFTDMHYRELNNYLPNGFEMLLIASPSKLEECNDSSIVCLSMPASKRDLINTLQMMSYRYTKRKKKEKEKPALRTEEDKVILDKAKQVLMVRNKMTEEEAHRYIQKNSMNSGTNLVEMAEMILKLME